MELRKRTSGRPLLVAVLLLLALGPAPRRLPAAPRAEPLDPLAQSVVDSLAFPPRTKPAELLDAAIRAADVEAHAVALSYVARLVDAIGQAGDGRLDLLADLGDGADADGLLRLERTVGGRDETVPEVLAAIRDAARMRRRDPERLARAAADLRSDSYAERLAAADRLARAGTDALPALVDVLGTGDAAGDRARGIARGLVRELGDDGRRALLDWLGTDDVPHWPGVIDALDAGGIDGIEEFLLAPAIVPDLPPDVRERAVAALRRQAERRGEVRGGAAVDVPPAAADAGARIAARLERLLSPDAVERPGEVCARLGSVPAGELPRAVRAREAAHLARDLVALGAVDASAVRLALLARLESLVAADGDQPGSLDRIEPQLLKEALSGPEGFDRAAVADVLDMAVMRRMNGAAAAAARSLGAGPDETSGPLPPAVRRSLVRALAIPDAGLQFEAAAALATAAGDPPYAGSSRVLATLLYAATSTGIDRVVVAHPDLAAAESIAAAVSRFGYRPLRVPTGREAIFAARDSRDTVLVLVAARINTPGALETVQFLQQQAVGDIPPVLVVVDPFDDECRGPFLTRLIMKFSDLKGVAIVDRLDSFFQALPGDAADVAPSGPRFPEALADVAGPQASDSAARAGRAAARLAQARRAIVLLGSLARRGWDVSAAVPTATHAIAEGTLRGPALSLLAAIGAARAQEAILRATEGDDLSAADRAVAVAAFQASVERHGNLLNCGGMLAAYARYNRATDAESREVAGEILDAIETPRTTFKPPSGDAAQPRPIR